MISSCQRNNILKRMNTFSAPYSHKRRIMLGICRHGKDKKRAEYHFSYVKFEREKMP